MRNEYFRESDENHKNLEGEYKDIANEKEVFNLANYFYSEGLYWSSYVIGDLNLNFEPNRILLVLSLYKLKFHKQIIRLFMQPKYQKLTFYSVIAKIAYSINCSEFVDLNKGQIKKFSVNEHLSEFSLNIESLLLYEKALNTTEGLRRKLLLESLDKDSNNIESLILLLTESIITYDEYLHRISLIKNSLIKNAILRNEENSNKSTFPLDSYTKLYRNEFSKSYYPSNDYPESVISIFKISVFCLLKEDVDKAINILTEIVDNFPCFGLGYLYLGIAKSYIRETEESRRNKKMALSIMGDNPLVLYHLGYDYYMCCNFKSATYYLKRMFMEMQRVSYNTSSKQIFFYNFYIYFLISIESYKEANQIIVDFHQPNEIDLMLKVYYFLFTQKYEMAYDLLRLEVDPSFIYKDNQAKYFYLLTKGYLSHLRDDFYEAVEFYKKALALSKADARIIQEIMHQAMLGITRKEKNIAFEFASTIFELLPYRIRKINIFL